MFKTYYKLAKPGIIYGNAINAIAGFLLASQDGYDFRLLMITLIGISLIVASACVFNNIWDAEIDAKMERTKNRAMAVKSITKSNAAVYGGLLFMLGATILHYHINDAALFAASFGFLVYVFLYTPLKRHTIYATQIGAVAGAMPAVAGYTAITNNFDLGAGILFLIIALWQMPHFYAIAIYRMDEYAAAGVPVLSVKKGINFTKISTLIYLIAFTASTSLLTVYGLTGYLYLAVMLLLGLIWLYKGVKGLSARGGSAFGGKVADDILWAKKMFRLSLIIILAFCVIIPIDKFFK